MLIEEINKRVNDNDFKFVCVSRPRRFGKSIAEDMLAAYYSKGADSRELFSPYKISKSPSFEKNLNKFNVIVNYDSESKKHECKIEKFVK